MASEAYAPERMVPAGELRGHQVELDATKKVIVAVVLIVVYVGVIRGDM